MRNNREAFDAALQITLAAIPVRSDVNVSKDGADKINEFFETVFVKLSALYETTSANYKS